MNTIEINEAINAKRKGTYRVVTAITKGKEGYEKVSTYIVRFGTKYIPTAEPKTITSQEIKDTWEGYVKNHQCKNGSISQTILMRTTKNPNHKAHCKYYFNGVEISREEYLINNPAKPYTQAISEWFTKKIADIISIK